MTMNPKYIFPSVMIILDLGACAVAIFQKDFKMAIYWFSAATLTASITF